LSFADRVARLNRTRRELIRPVQEHPRDYVLMSIRAMAQSLKTDPATVLRIVRGIGFSSYREFKAYLHELSIARATSLEGMQQSSPHDSSLASHGRRALEGDLHNLHSLRNTLDMERVSQLAKRIYDAHRVVLLGGDMAIGLIDFPNLAAYEAYRAELLSDADAAACLRRAEAAGCILNEDRSFLRRVAN